MPSVKDTTTIKKKAKDYLQKGLKRWEEMTVLLIYAKMGKPIYLSKTAMRNPK